MGSLSLGPSYYVSIATSDYNVTCSIGISPSTRDELFARTPDFMPTTPDIVIQVRSEREKERDRLGMELKRKEDEEKMQRTKQHRLARQTPSPRHPVLSREQQSLQDHPRNIIL